MNKLLKEHFDSMAKANKIGHAFLLCNTKLDNLKDELEIILSDYFFHSKIKLEENIDIYIIKPTNGKIIKEEILALQEEFKHFSQINENRVYIIDGVEKMNEHASNSILKFLEEPEQNIYAFLISANIAKVLPTIKSRCQIINIGDFLKFDITLYEQSYLDNIIEFILMFEKEKERILAFMYKYINKKEEKENIINIVNIFKYFYHDVLDYKLKGSIKYFYNYKDKIEYVMSINTEKTLISKLIILNKKENMLEYNLNISLFIDELFIEMGRIKDE